MKNSLDFFFNNPDYFLFAQNFLKNTEDFPDCYSKLF